MNTKFDFQDSVKKKSKTPQHTLFFILFFCFLKKVSLKSAKEMDLKRHAVVHSQIRIFEKFVTKLEKVNGKVDFINEDMTGNNKTIIFV